MLFDVVLPLFPDGLRFGFAEISNG